jgi:hypothetical protein
VLPPLAYRDGSFYLSEFTFHDITTKYTKEGDKYYCEFAHWPRKEPGAGITAKEPNLAPNKGKDHCQIPTPSGGHITEQAIRAEAHSDDHIQEVEFDASPWFRQASDQEILDLAACDWGGDYPADGVAEFMSGQNPDLDALFGYLHSIHNLRSKTDCCGFECHVNSDDAIAWLKQHRPALAALLDEETPTPQDVVPSKGGSPSHSVETPWGPSQTIREIAPGITLYTTASHGGYYLSPERVAVMPKPLRDFKPFTSGPGPGKWYEEDCDWAVIAVAFPQFFPADASTTALSTLKGYMSEVYEQMMAMREAGGRGV